MARNKEKYNAAFRVALERALKHAWVPLSPEDLATRCSWVLTLKESGRQLRLRNARQSQHPGVAAEFVERSYALRHTDPQTSMCLGRVAVDAAEALHLGQDWAELTADLQAQAWGNLANCYRLTGQFAEAAEAWEQSDAALARGTGDPLLQADLARKQGNFRRAEGRYEDSSLALARAAELFRRCGEGHASGKSQLDLAVTHFYADDPKQALAAGKKAAKLIDIQAEPEMGLALYHNTLFFLEADGQHEMAFIVSGRIAWWYEVLESPLLAARYQWLRGRLAFAAGATEAAARHADEARRSLLAEGQIFDAALAGFDTCLAMLKNGAFLAVQRLAQEMYGVFTSKDLPREAHAALLLFADAARSGRATVSLAERVAGELVPLRRPGYRPAL